MELGDGPVEYEAFGAMGDGVADDMPAICAAHDYANERGLAVRSNPEATYHLGGRPLTAVIETDTDWGTSRFTVDDTVAEDNKQSLFAVRSRLESEEVRIETLARDQQQVEARPRHDCHVRIENDAKRLFIRRGLNQNNGVPQSDCFILRRDGAVEGPVDWDYEHISRIEARPIDPEPLTLRGGVFTTFANRMRQEEGYNYWSRNIAVSRSNTCIEGLTHYVVGETAVGHPYSGFVNVQQCADITLRDCFFSGHKIYSTLGAAGKPVSMGSYDVNANNVVNFSMVGCRMNHVNDRTRWGVIGSNFCKNILLEDCVLSRMDTHMGVSGGYTVRRCTLGWMGLNAIGRGTLLVEDSTLYGNALVNFRADYGSTWEGDVVVRDCRWVPAGGRQCQPCMIGVKNDGMHDFGYPCSMPAEVRVDGLYVDDSNHPEGYEGMYLFADPDDTDAGVPGAERPFLYTPCRKVTLRGMQTASGKPVRLSPAAGAAEVTAVVEEG